MEGLSIWLADLFSVLAGCCLFCLAPVAIGHRKGVIMYATYLLHATAETATSTLAAVIVALVVGVVAGMAMKSKLFN